jgi:hypothetical protein
MQGNSGSFAADNRINGDGALFILEGVEVDEHDRKAMAFARGVNYFGQPVDQYRAVRQPGQFVVKREVPDAFIVAPAIGDVVEYRNVSFIAQPKALQSIAALQLEVSSKRPGT